MPPRPVVASGVSFSDHPPACIQAARRATWAASMSKASNRSPHRAPMFAPVPSGNQRATSSGSDDAWRCHSRMAGSFDRGRTGNTRQPTAA